MPPNLLASKPLGHEIPYNFVEMSQRKLCEAGGS
jgi:hypothetical protein